MNVSEMKRNSHRRGWGKRPL